MAFSEIFPYPTVKKVIFQIRYPNLFYLESKIGTFQIEIMEDFPQSSIITRKSLLVANYRSDVKSIDLENMDDTDEIQKIWQFKDKNDTVVNVQSNFLSISSTAHKTYNNQDSPFKFRETIKSVVDHFIKIINVPIITRIGLRYIDECPIDEKTDDNFKRLYHSIFPYDRFSIEKTEGMQFFTTIKKDDKFLRYSESIMKNNDKFLLLLDYDGFALNIKPDNYLVVLDSLHTIVADEFENTIKQPIQEYMRTGVLK